MECKEFHYCPNCDRTFPDVEILEARLHKLREALALALAAMNHMGDFVNGMDAASQKSVGQVAPAFKAVRDALGVH